MSKRPSDEELRSDMNKYARALLQAAYGDIVNGALPEEGVKPDVFNSVVNWIRTDSGLEPLTQARTGLDALKDKMNGKR